MALRVHSRDQITNRRTVSTCHAVLSVVWHTQENPSYPNFLNKNCPDFANFATTLDNVTKNLQSLIVTYYMYMYD